MKKTFILLWLVTLLICTLTATTDHDYSDNTVIVVLKPEISNPTKSVDDSFFGDLQNATIENISLIHNPKAIEALAQRNSQYQSIYKLTLPTHDKALVQATIDILNQNPQIDYATPDYILHPNIIPNDEYYETLWGLHGTHGIKAPQAWDITTGSPNIKVGVIDSGIANHPDLDANLTTGYDFVNNNTITTDDYNGHGTHVAGIIGAVGDNEIGVVGVNWNVTLFPMQVDDAGDIFSSVVASAINYATNTWGTDEQISVLSQSISGYGRNNPDPRLPAINNYPGLCVWAAGNGGSDSIGDDLDNLSTIAIYNLSNIIAVGAIQSDGQKSTFSDYSSSGVYVPIFAPGTNIGSTYLSNGYETMSGTSMATPHVSGVAALLLSVNPALSATEIKQMIINSADLLTISTPTGQLTVNRLNAHQAVQIASGQPFIAISPRFHNFGSVDIGQTSQSLSFTVTSTGDEPFTINSINISGTHENDFTLSATDLPWTLNTGDFETFSVTFTPSYAGLKTADVYIWASEGDFPFVVPLSGVGWGTANIPYYQDFDQTNSLEDISWGGNISPDSGILANCGVNGTNGLILYLDSVNPAQNVFTPTLIGVTEQTKLAFTYRILDHQTSSEMPLFQGEKIITEISTTGASGAYSTLHEIHWENHYPAPYFATLLLPLTAYAGQNINIRFRVNRIVLSWDFVLDDVLVSEHVTLEPPQNLTATPGEDSVILSWQAPLHQTPLFYRVYRDGSPLFYYVLEPSTLSCEDNTAINGTEYTYYVSAGYSWETEVASATVTVVAGPGAELDEVSVPAVTCLTGNYPNPFNPSTTISFNVARSGFVNIEVYNVRGQRVRSLVSGVYGAGEHSVVWNGASDAGVGVGSGVYFYRMVSSGFTGVKKMLLLK